MLSFIADLWKFIKEHPKFFIPLTIFLLVWVAFDFWFYVLPGSVIPNYYQTLSSDNPEQAYELLEKKYREDMWSGGPEEFADLYATFTYPRNLRLDPEKIKLKDISSCLWSQSRTYMVSYDVYERFTKEDLEKAGYKENRLWVQIAHPRDYPRLMDGTLSEKSLFLIRSFVKKITIQKVNGKWKIASIQQLFRGLKRANPDGN